MSLGRTAAEGSEWRAPAGSLDRRLYLDNLKVLLIAAIIAMHGVLGYASLEVWTYTGVREVTLHPTVEAILFVAVLPFGLVLMALFFLVAGLLTVPSVERKGPGLFARDRLLRLGVPFAVYVLVVQPTTVYLLEHPLGVATGSYWAEFLGEEGVLDTGPLWFVGVLLIYSLGYAGWVRLRGGGRRPDGSGAITAGRLVVVVALVAPASFAIRLVYPYGGDAGPTDLNFWQWPACVATFGLGILAARQGWEEAVPGVLRRTARTVSVVAVLAMAALLTTAGLREVFDDLLGGPHLLAAGFAAVDAVLCVFGSVWMLAGAQRRLIRALPGGSSLARSAYGAFLLQTPVLIGLALALRPVGLPAEVKALMVAGGGVAASFALAWVLIRRVPGLHRVL